MKNLTKIKISLLTTLLFVFITVMPVAASTGSNFGANWTIGVGVVCLLISAGIALAILFGMKSSHKTAKPQRAACNYVKKGSLNLTTQKDLFLFSRIVKIPRAQSNSGGRGGGRRR